MLFLRYKHIYIYIITIYNYTLTVLKAFLRSVKQTQKTHFFFEKCGFSFLGLLVFCLLFSVVYPSVKHLDLDFGTSRRLEQTGLCWNHWTCLNIEDLWIRLALSQDEALVWEFGRLQEL